MQRGWRAQCAEKAQKEKLRAQAAAAKRAGGGAAAGAAAAAAAFEAAEAAGGKQQGKAGKHAAWLVPGLCSRWRVNVLRLCMVDGH